MRFFDDHCVPESVAEALETKGYEVFRLRNQMATDAPDDEVIEKAQQIDAVLLSLNGDFSDIVRYPPSDYGGIVSMQEVLDQDVTLPLHSAKMFTTSGHNEICRQSERCIG